MSPARTFVVTAVIAALYACTQQGSRTGMAAGTVDIGPTATRTVLIRVQNDYPMRVQIFSIVGNNRSELTNLASGGAGTVLLDANSFPGTLFSLEIVPATGPVKQIGPFRLARGQTAHLIVTPNLDSARVEIRPTVPQ
jgi:hypothetical protein